MGIEAEAVASEILGDLYSVFRVLVDDARLPVKRVYFDRLVGDNFQRPSYQIKFITLRNEPGNFAHKTASLDVMVKYFASSEFEAITAAAVIMDILSGWPDKTLPKYDFRENPPKKLTLSGKDQYGNDAPWAVGIRIESSTVKGEPFKTEDDLWEVPVTFTMRSPRYRDLQLTTITSISYELLTQALLLPVELEMELPAYQSVDQT